MTTRIIAFGATVSVALGALHCQKRTTPEPLITEPVFETDTGPALVRVLDGQTDAPLIGARVWFADTQTTRGTSPETAQDVTAHTDAKTVGTAGFVFFSEATSGMRVLNVTHSGYEPGIARIAVQPRNSTVHTIRLARAKTVQLAGAKDTARIRETTYSIDIPADTFAGPGDTPIEIRYAMTEPTPAGIRAMPGGFRGVIPVKGSNMERRGAAGEDAKTVPLASYGAISISALRGGEKLNIAPGKSIRVRFACQTACAGPTQPANTVPLWSLDESTGLWRAEGTARVVLQANGYWIEADLPHLSSWNADFPLYAKSSILVRSFVDATGQALSDPSIFAEGLDQLTTLGGTLGMRTEFSDGLCLEVPPNTRVRLRAMAWRGDTAFEGEQEFQTGPPGSDCFENRAGAVTIATFQVDRSPQADAIRDIGREELSRLYGRFDLIETHDGTQMFGAIIQQARNILTVQTIQGRVQIPVRLVESITFP